MPQAEYLTYPRHIAEIWEEYARRGPASSLRLTGFTQTRANGVRAQLYTYRRMLLRATVDGDQMAAELYASCENAVIDRVDAGGDGWAVVISPHPAIASLRAAKKEDTT